MEFLQILGLILGGGGIATLFNFLLGNRKEIRSDFLEIITTLKDDNKRLREEQDKDRAKADETEQNLRAMISSLERDLTAFRAHLIVLESSHYDHPYPTWLRSSTGEFIVINKAFEEAFLLPLGKTSLDLLGKRDETIWPAHIAQEHRRNFEHVLRTKTVWEGFETMLDRAGKEVKVRIIKYPRFSGRTVIGVSAQVIPDLAT